MDIDKLVDIVIKYNNTYAKKFKIEPLNVKSYKFDFNKGNNKGNPNFEIDHHVRVLKYKNIIAKGYVPNWSDNIFVTKKVKNITP